MCYPDVPDRDVYPVGAEVTEKGPDFQRDRIWESFAAHPRGSGLDENIGCLDRENPACLQRMGVQVEQLDAMTKGNLAMPELKPRGQELVDVAPTPLAVHLEEDHVGGRQPVAQPLQDDELETFRVDLEDRDGFAGRHNAADGLGGFAQLDLGRFALVVASLDHRAGTEPEAAREVDGVGLVALTEAMRMELHLRQAREVVPEQFLVFPNGLERVDASRRELHVKEHARETDVAADVEDHTWMRMTEEMGGILAAIKDGAAIIQRALGNVQKASFSADHELRRDEIGAGKSN